MKKDLNWLKEEVEMIKKNMESASERTGQTHREEGYVRGGHDGMQRVLVLIDQVEQPALLSQEWIDDRKCYDEEIDAEFVYVDELKSLLVPKLDLPVIPAFVAEWIETIRELNGDIVGSVIYGNYNGKVGDWLFLDDDTTNVVNTEKLMNAWKYGYTVEEKKYYARSLLSSLPNFKNSGEHFFSTFPNTTSNDIWLTTKNNAVTLTEKEWAKLYVNENNALFIEKNAAVEELEK